MSAFKYDVENGKAEAKLYSMFKFPESNRVHFQCDILVCNGKCESIPQRHIILFGRLKVIKGYEPNKHIKIFMHSNQKYLKFNLCRDNVYFAFRLIKYIDDFDEQEI